MNCSNCPENICDKLCPFYEPDFQLNLLELNSKFDDIKNYLENLRTDLSKTRSLNDQEVNNVYHTIEQTNFNASQGYKLAKQLKLALQERRKIKEIYSYTDHINNHLKNIKSVKEYEEKT
jgi:hypothetical protein